MSWRVDPRWAPPEPIPHRPGRVAIVFAVLLPIALLLVLAAPLGAVWGLDRLRPVSTTAPPLDPTAVDGSIGVGDPYYREAGNGGYDVGRYDISVDWDTKTQMLRGTTTIFATATHQLDSFYFDLALPTTKVSVDGAPATVGKKDFSDVQVHPARPIGRGATFAVTVEYSGKPGDLKQDRVQPFWTAEDEWLAAGEPESAAWWYPSNDHPSDPAVMDVSIRVPVGYQAISTGSLESADTAKEADHDTWHWLTRQPAATYLTFLAIGHYDIKRGTDAGRPYVYAVSTKLSEQDRKIAMDALLTTGPRVRALEKLFGPYPFTEIGGIVPVHPLWFDGLECQTRPVYVGASITNADYRSELLDHELAHQWFGDNVTVRQWNDIFTNEAYASWATWATTEATGGRKANDQLNRLYSRVVDNSRFWRITMIDPGVDHLFDVVYARGPMTLQALRNVMGDEAFSRLNRQWAQTPGTRSLEDWMAAAQAQTTVDLQPFFQAWIYGTTAPARTAANGFPA